MRALSHPEAIADEDPIVLWSCCGTHIHGEPYWEVWFFNGNLETYRVHFIFAAPHKDVASVTCEIPMTEKDLDYISVIGLRPELVTWEDFLAVSSADGSVRRVQLDGYITYPSAEGVHGCVAVEDRSGRRSSFVPIVQFDYPRGE